MTKKSLTPSSISRFIPFALILLSLFVAVVLGHPVWTAVLLLLALLGVRDLIQVNHNLYRYYPIVGHFRWLAEQIRPQIHQYFIESDTEGRPFDREQCDLVYQRAKNSKDSLPLWYRTRRHRRRLRMA